MIDGMDLAELSLELGVNKIESTIKICKLWDCSRVGEQSDVCYIPGWIPLLHLQLKANTDGCWIPHSNQMKGGGILRNSTEVWMLGFVFTLFGVGSLFLAELRAVLQGVKLVWDSHFLVVVFEMDCKEVFQILHFVVEVA
ncbi:hypothetical protein RJT34_12350 [Clitoria ternatea]|uniref:RNase H type-1 domain-containing protein n=1 Tax=Clitoria ternatea TaxID=43366 RepID=A0AAN9JLK0_CLITE